jgi:hypothetical protein
MMCNIKMTSLIATLIDRLGRMVFEMFLHCKIAIFPFILEDSH